MTKTISKGRGRGRTQRRGRGQRRGRTQRRGRGQRGGLCNSVDGVEQCIPGGGRGQRRGRGQRGGRLYWGNDPVLQGQ